MVIKPWLDYTEEDKFIYNEEEIPRYKKKSNPSIVRAIQFTAETVLECVWFLGKEFLSVKSSIDGKISLYCDTCQIKPSQYIIKTYTNYYYILNEEEFNREYECL